MPTRLFVRKLCKKFLKIFWIFFFCIHLAKLILFTCLFRISNLENNPVFLTTYGKALGFGKHYSDAITVLEKAVKRQPLSASYIELGKSYEAAGLPAEALASWNQASLMVPSRFAPLYLTMNLYFKNREYDRAQEYAGQLLTKKVKIDNPEIDKMKRDARDILNGAKPP